MFKGTTICAVRRDGCTAIAGDGQVTMGENVIMKGTAISPDANIMGSARDLAPAIAKDPWAIGYASLQNVDAINREHFKIAPLKVDGNEPDEENLVNGRYPLVLPFIIMTSRRADPFVRVFLEFIYGQEGWDIIHARGYHPSFKPGDTKQIYVSEPLNP